MKKISHPSGWLILALLKHCKGQLSGRYSVVFLISKYELLSLNPHGRTDATSVFIVGNCYSAIIINIRCEAGGARLKPAIIVDTDKCRMMYLYVD